MNHEELQAVCKTDMERKVLARLIKRAQAAQRQEDSPFKNLRICNVQIATDPLVRCGLIHGHAGDHYNVQYDIHTSSGTRQLWDGDSYTHNPNGSINDNSVTWRAEQQTFNSWAPPYNVVQYDDPPIDQSIVMDAIRRLKENPPAGSMYGASVHVNPALPEKTLILINESTLSDIERNIHSQSGMWV